MQQEIHTRDLKHGDMKDETPIIDEKEQSDDTKKKDTYRLQSFPTFRGFLPGGLVEELVLGG